MCTFSSRKLTRTSSSQKESKFSISSSGVQIWLAEVLDGLVYDEQLGRLYANKSAHAQIKVVDGSATSVKVSFVMEIAHSSRCQHSIASFKCRAFQPSLECKKMYIKCILLLLIFTQIIVKFVSPF